MARAILPKVSHPKTPSSPKKVSIAEKKTHEEEKGGPTKTEINEETQPNKKTRTDLEEALLKVGYPEECLAEVLVPQIPGKETEEDADDAEDIKSNSDNDSRKDSDSEDDEEEVGKKKPSNLKTTGEDSESSLDSLADTDEDKGPDQSEIPPDHGSLGVILYHLLTREQYDSINFHPYKTKNVDVEDEDEDDDFIIGNRVELDETHITLKNLTTLLTKHLGDRLVSLKDWECDYTVLVNQKEKKNPNVHNFYIVQGELERREKKHIPEPDESCGFSARGIQYVHCFRKDRVDIWLNRQKYQAAFLIDFEAEPGIFLTNDQRDESMCYLPRPISWLMLDQETGKPEPPDAYFRRFVRVIQITVKAEEVKTPEPHASEPSAK